MAQSDRSNNPLIPRSGVTQATNAQDTPEENLRTLFSEVSALAVRLRQAEGRLADVDGFEAKGRSILQIIERLGPQTVPQIAQVRLTSRQNVQILVNWLKAQGCVESMNNSAHKRSWLVSLTPRGKAVLVDWARNEAVLLGSLAPHVSQTDLKCAISLVSDIRRLLRSGAKPAAQNDGAPQAMRRRQRERTERKATPLATEVEPAPPSGEAFYQNELPVSLL